MIHNFITLFGLVHKDWKQDYNFIVDHSKE